MTSPIDISPDPCFERIRKTLTLEGKPDRLPLADFLVAPNIMEWVAGRKLKTVKYRSGEKEYECPEIQGQLDFWLNAGYDYVHMRPFYDFGLSDFTDKEGSASMEGTGEITTLEILHSKKWPWQKTEDFCYQHIVDIAEILPEEMKLIISTGDIFTYTWEAMGFTHFCLCLYENPELVAELFQQIGEANYLLNTRTVELVGDKIGAIWYTDDLAYSTGTFVNPEVYREHLFPWVKKLSQLADELNVPFIYHTDGNLWEIFPDFYELGINAIHPLEPNSMSAEEVKKEWGDRFCLIGNVDLDLLSRGQPKEVEEMVIDRMKKLGYNGGYCVGTSNTIAPYVKPENFKVMVETVFRYGQI